MAKINPRDYMDIDRTLCQRCANACGNCEWSKRFETVKGWTAEKTSVHIGYAAGRDKNVVSYLVTQCPKFQADETRHTKTIRTDRVKTFAFKLILSAIEDYADALAKRNKARKNSSPWDTEGVIIECEKYLKCDMVGDMLELLGIKMSSERMLQFVREDPQGTLHRLRTMMDDRHKEREDEYTEEYNAIAERKRHDRNSKKHV